MKSHWLALLTLAISLLTPLQAATAAFAPVTLQLREGHSFAFAGYYAAQAKGFYKAAGLKVTIRPGGPQVDPLLEVIEGRAQFGTGTGQLLLAHQQGKPVVVLASIFQHTPPALMRHEEPAGQTPFYGDNLFTRRSELERHPARARAFSQASLKGWQYALAHPQEIAALILAKYGTAQSAEALAAQAEQMNRLASAHLIEMGHGSPERWQELADHYIAQGQLPASFQLDGFLYRGEPRFNHTWLLAAVTLTVLALVMVLYTLGLNRRLDQALKRSRLTEQALRKSEERHRLLADNATDVIWTMDLSGNITYISPSIKRLLGLETDEMVGRPLSNWLTEDSAALFHDRLQQFDERLRDDQALEEFRAELEIQRPGGEPLWIEATLSEMRNKKGAFIGLLGVARDITQRREVEQRVNHMARHDLLTDLPNRALFNDRLRQALAHATRYQHRLAVLFIDLDRFKPINDTYGHDVGDQLLKQVAMRMQACIRTTDTLARVGGDEFVVLLSRVPDARAATQVANKLHQVLCEPFDLANRQLQISASIGIALYPLHGHNEAELCKHADEAMYQAKKQGRDGIRLYEAALH